MNSWFNSKFVYLSFTYSDLKKTKGIYFCPKCWLAIAGEEYMLEGFIDI